MSGALATALAQLPALGELFRLFSSGKHLNRLSEAALWAELEKQQADYVRLFAALGYDLRVDARGFAWFHSTEAHASINKTSRQMALLWMLIFDAQANAGQALQRFSDWRLDRAWLAELEQQHREVLLAENITLDGLHELLNRACTLGLAQADAGAWRLLPALHRYLDHFLALAADAQDDDDPDAFEDEPERPLIDEGDDEPSDNLDDDQGDDSDHGEQD